MLMRSTASLMLPSWLGSRERSMAWRTAVPLQPDVTAEHALNA
jgi:hypothetical protein